MSATSESHTLTLPTDLTAKVEAMAAQERRSASEVLRDALERYRRQRPERQVLTLADFTDADIAALEATRAPESSKAFDDELMQ